MGDMTPVIAPKCDELTADDLLSGPRTVTITRTEVRHGQERPVTIWFVGDEGRPFKPCKTVSRVFVNAWGNDSANYVGKTMTVYRDPNVTWGGMKVGGVRISHMSHIEREMVIALTATKGKKVMATIKPLVVEQAKPKADAAANWANEHMARLGQIDTPDDLNDHIQKGAKSVAKLANERPDLHAKVIAAYDVRRDMLTPSEGRPDADMGEGFNDTDETFS